MSNLEIKTEKPKRTLNPIIKAMNDYRNNVIGEHIGSKAPKRTAPIFKVTLAAARSSLDMEESEKNTIGVVEKASELFSANPDKFLKLADKLEKEDAKKPDTEKKTKGKSKKEVVKESSTKKTKSKSKTAQVEEEPSETVEVKPSKASLKKKAASPAKAKKVKEVVKPTVVDSDSDSDDESDSGSDSD